MFYADIINSLKTNFFFRRSTPCTAKAVFVTTTTSNTTLLKVDPNNSIPVVRVSMLSVVMLPKKNLMDFCQPCGKLGFILDNYKIMSCSRTFQWMYFAYNIQWLYIVLDRSMYLWFYDYPVLPLKKTRNSHGWI